MPYPLAHVKSPFSLDRPFFRSRGDLLAGIRIVPRLAACVAPEHGVVQFSTVSQHDLLETTNRVAVFGSIQIDGDHVAGLEGSLGPTDQPERLRGSGFADPMHDFAICALSVKIDQTVRIGSREFRDGYLLKLCYAVRIC